MHFAMVSLFLLTYLNLNVLGFYFLAFTGLLLFSLHCALGPERNWAKAYCSLEALSICWPERIESISMLSGCLQLSLLP